MNLKTFFLSDKEEFETLKDSRFYKLLEESSKYLNIKFSSRTEETQFHFDCKNGSYRSIYQIIYKLLTNEQKKEILEKSGFRGLNQVPNSSKEKDMSFGVYLNKKLESVNVDIQTHNKETYCIYLRSDQDADCVGSILHGYKFKMQMDSDRYDFVNLELLNEYANKDQISDVRNYFNMYGLVDELRFEYGPGIMICYIQPLK